MVADPEGRKRQAGITSQALSWAIGAFRGAHEGGRQLVEKMAPNALAISRERLAPLDSRERETLVALLSKLR